MKHYRATLIKAGHIKGQAWRFLPTGAYMDGYYIEPPTVGERFWFYIDGHISEGLCTSKVTSILHVNQASGMDKLVIKSMPKLEGDLPKFELGDIVIATLNSVYILRGVAMELAA